MRFQEGKELMEGTLIKHPLTAIVYLLGSQNWDLVEFPGGLEGNSRIGIG
jgi:hypothetical protein